MQILTNDIVNDGLLFYLDAGIKGSYPGSGSDVKDLARDSTVTATNVTFGSDAFSFNGSSSYINWVAQSSLGTNFTIELWCKPENTITLHAQGGGSTSGNREVIFPINGGATNAGVGISLGANGLCVIQHGSALYGPILTQAYAFSARFYHLVVTLQNKVPTLYIDGAFVKTGISSSRTQILLYYKIGFGAYGYFQGDVALARMYSRTLSAAEVAQNFEATRNRFGI